MEERINKARFITKFASEKQAKTHPDSKHMSHAKEMFETTRSLERPNASLIGLTKEQKEALDHHQGSHGKFFASVDHNTEDDQLRKLIDANSGDVVHIKHHIVGHFSKSAADEFNELELDKDVSDHILKMESNPVNKIKTTDAVIGDQDGYNYYDHAVLHPGKYIKTGIDYEKGTSRLTHNFYRADDDFEETK